MEKDSIETSLVETLKNSELAKVAEITAELSVDGIIDDGLFRDIPVISTIVSFAKVGISVKSYFFSKKLIRFLASISEVSREDRKKMIERLEADKSFRHKVGENIILLLDRLDDLEKPELVAKAFKAYSYGFIDAEQLQRINYAIERLLMVDIGNIREFSAISQDHPYDVIIGQNYLNAGLAYVGTGFGEGGIHPNDICQLLVKHILAAES